MINCTVSLGVRTWRESVTSLASHSIVNYSTGARHPPPPIPLRNPGARQTCTTYLCLYRRTSFHDTNSRFSQSVSGMLSSLVHTCCDFFTFTRSNFLHSLRLTAWSRTLLEQLMVGSGSQETPRIVCNPKAHYVFTRAGHESLS